MIVLETQRLTLRHASLDDAPFILRLLNEPSFLQFIGDRGVRSLDDARGYIADRLIGSYERNGFGLWVVTARDSAPPMGICGLVRRDTLPDPDIGFAFLPEYWRGGIGFESAAGVRDYAFETLGIPRLLAIVSPENAASIGLLEKLGFTFEQLSDPDDGKPVRVYALDARG
jgi:RimJ/RimL family protein N-acetyltransferase